ncbi:MAG: hypothetical protein ACQET5_11715 [Halobacteriota archaeon]|uniref:hypothetical protein n=1 Tax=Natronomonas sp. TaxID=2184060 RepID=UPI003975669A
MGDSTVICETISNFENRSFERNDKFRNAVIVPQEVLSALDETVEYEYVRLTPHGSDDFGALTQIVCFSNVHDPEKYSRDDVYLACIRTSLQRRIGLDAEDIESEESDIKIDIHEIQSEIKSGLRVHRISAWEQQSRDVTTEGFACYIHSGDLVDLQGLENGDVAELINPIEGFRIQLPVETYRHKHYDEHTIRLNGVIRTLLDVNSTDEGVSQTVKLRVLENKRTASYQFYRKISTWIGRLFVDYSYTHLRVLPGYDRDEGRNIVRVNEDTMEGLGIEENDRALIRWKNEERNVRCQTGWENDTKLEPGETPESSHGENESLAIRMPSSERDRLDISVGDSVRIRRDMRYQAGKQVSYSVFGILGVIVGTNQIITMVLDELNYQYFIITTLTILVLSIATIWFILNPIRQKCRMPQ